MSQLKRPFDGKWQCVHCGETGISDTMKFCPECGANLVVDGEPGYSDVTNTTRGPIPGITMSSGRQFYGTDPASRRQYLESPEYTGEDAPAERRSWLDSSREEMARDRAQQVFDDADGEYLDAAADFPEDDMAWDDLTPDARHRWLRKVNAGMARDAAAKALESAERVLRMREAPFEAARRETQDEYGRQRMARRFDPYEIGRFADE